MPHSVPSIFYFLIQKKKRDKFNVKFLNFGRYENETI